MKSLLNLAADLPYKLSMRMCVVVAVSLCLTLRVTVAKRKVSMSLISFKREHQHTLYFAEIEFSYLLWAFSYISNRGVVPQWDVNKFVLFPILLLTRLLYATVYFRPTPFCLRQGFAIFSSFSLAQVRQKYLSYSEDTRLQVPFKSAPW